MARPGSLKECKVNESELYFLIARFLEQGPCRHTAQVLKDELAEKQLLPKRKNWEGGEHQLSYEEAVQQAGHIATNHLQLLCSNHLSLLEHHGYQATPGLHSLLGAGITACIANDSWKQNGFLPRSLLHASCFHKELVVGIRKAPVANMCQLVEARHLTPDFIRPVLCGPQFYKDFKKHRTILGHLAPVFCVMFDHTGRCIITGADDDLLKVWSSHSGQLLATLRGHSAEVTDISLSVDNTMIASGSLDKTVRVWCAQTSAPVAVLAGHQSHITSVQFSPSPIEEYRYLASTGKGGFLCFWQWLPESCTFNSSPIKFMEKNRVGDQTLCSAFSPGGKYFVTGGTDRIIRVYQCIPGPPTIMAEIETHKDRIMTIQFGNTGDSMFATGSCDGTARVWRFREEGWTSTAIRIPTDELARMSIETARTGKPDKPQVTMVGWEKTDTYFTTAFSPDCIVRVYRSGDGTLLHRLQGHTGEVFVLEAHPTNSRILLTAGHDGLVIVWDILAGVQIQRFLTEHEDEGSSIPCIFDCKFSPDGLSCAAVDSTGYLTVYGFGSSQLYEQNPQDQFFHTDYRPLMRDRNHFVVDEQSQLPPHLLPPPYLVDIDGRAHPDRYQEAILRLIRPARLDKQEKASEEDEDYDEYMKRHLEQVKQQSFGFGRARVAMNARAANSRNMEVENRESGANEVSLTSSGVSESQSHTVSTDTLTSTSNDTAPLTSSQNGLPSTDSTACTANSVVATNGTELLHVSVAEVDTCGSATSEAVNGGDLTATATPSVSASRSVHTVDEPCHTSAVSCHTSAVSCHTSAVCGAGDTANLTTPPAPIPSSISASQTDLTTPSTPNPSSVSASQTDLTTPALNPSSVSASQTDLTTPALNPSSVSASQTAPSALNPSSVSASQTDFTTPALNPSSVSASLTDFTTPALNPSSISVSQTDFTTPAYNPSSVSASLTDLTTPALNPSSVSASQTDFTTPALNPSSVSASQTDLTTPVYNPSSVSASLTDLTTPALNPSSVSASQTDFTTPALNPSSISVSQTDFTTPALNPSSVSASQTDFTTPALNPSSISVSQTDFTTPALNPSSVSASQSDLTTPALNPSSVSASQTDLTTPALNPSSVSASQTDLTTPALNPSSVSASQSALTTPSTLNPSSVFASQTDLTTPSLNPSSVSASQSEVERVLENQHHARAAMDVCDTPQLTASSTPSITASGFPANNSEITEPRQVNVTGEHSYASPETACSCAREEDVAMDTSAQPKGSSFLSPEQQHQRMVLAVVIDGHRTQQGDGEGSIGAHSALQHEGELGDLAGQSGGSDSRGDAQSGVSGSRGDSQSGGSGSRGDAQSGGSGRRGDSQSGGSGSSGDSQSGGSGSRGDSQSGGSGSSGDSQSGGSGSRGDSQSGVSGSRGDSQSGGSGSRGDSQSGVSGSRGDSQSGVSDSREDSQPRSESIGKPENSVSGSPPGSSCQLPSAVSQPLSSHLSADERHVGLRTRSGSRKRSSIPVPFPDVPESPAVPAIPVPAPPSRENGNRFQEALPPGGEIGNGPQVAPAPGFENDNEPLVEVMEEDEDGSGRSIPNMLASLVYSLDLSSAEASQAISLWRSRTIIPPLDLAILRSEQARRQQILDEEERNFEEQIRKRDQLPLSPSPPPQVKTHHGRELRSGRTLPGPSEPTRVSPSRESEMSEISSVGGEESAMEEEVWEVESTASSDISDWTTEAGIKFISSERKRNKKERKRAKSTPESSSDQEDDEEEEGVGLEAGPSSSQQRRRERSKKDEKPKKKRPPIKPSVDYTVYWPPDWLKQTRPLATPYFPQVGDIVVYFRQGHELYVNAVREEKVYSCKTQMPWQKYNLLPHEMCQVKNVHYVKGPPTLCSIALVLLSPTVHDDGPSTSRERPTFTFKYHDMDGVLDFLVLECVYKASIEKLWQPGERFCSLIDGTLWRGEVKKREPFSEELPNSSWQCYHVAWDDGATDQLSPWDMEPMPQEGEELDPSARMVALLASQTAEDPTEAWGGPEERERERILNGLDVVEGLDEAAMFVEPVDLEEVLDYCVAVPFPTDLSTIRERLRNGFYRRKTPLLWEVVQLGRNTVAYNEDDSLIVKHARVLVQTLRKFIMTPSCTDPLTCYEPEPTGEVEVDVMAPEVDFVPPALPDQESETSCVPSPRKRRAQRLSTDSPEIPKLPPWTQKSEDFLDRMVANENSPPFLQPVDANEYPDYPLTISHPMDLGTVREKLLVGDYKVPNDFISDVRLIFSNAKKYNRKGSNIYKMTTELQSAFETEVLDFLNSCQEGREVAHTHATRRNLGLLASAEDDSRGTNSVVARIQRPMRLRSADERLSEDGSTSASASVAASTPTTPVSEISCVRETRSMSLMLRKTQSETDRFSMKLRSRETRKRLLEESDSDEAEEEDEDEDLPPRRSRRRGPERTLRKRARMASSDSDSGSENSFDDLPAIHTVTRKGRVVKPTSKFS